MIRHLLGLLCFLLLTTTVLAQYNTEHPLPEKQGFWSPADTLNMQRGKAMAWTTGALTAGSLLWLNQMWYASYERTPLHSYDDSGEWLGMDKIGHALSVYHAGYLGMKSMEWAGYNKRQALWIGGSYGWFYMLAVELMDGRSSGWGFSWSDMMANTAGYALLAAQELTWGEQRMRLKYSFSPSPYAQYRPEVLGENLSQQWLKDYNGQTYWLSINIASFVPWERFPNWLNLAFGYGAEAMLTGFPEDNHWGSDGRYRQFYLSFDVDLTRIRTKSPFVNTLFDAIGFVKFPAPALEYNSKGQWDFHFLHF